MQRVIKLDVNYTISKQDEALIEEYINQNLYEPVSDAKIHSIFEVLGSNMSKGELYFWVIVQEVDQERNKTGTILSGPVLLKVRQGEEGLKFLNTKSREMVSSIIRILIRCFQKKSEKKLHTLIRLN